MDKEGIARTTYTGMKLLFEKRSKKPSSTNKEEREKKLI
jgi:hypothetical protein